jgi:hypothetical protein
MLLKQRWLHANTGRTWLSCKALSCTAGATAVQLLCFCCCTYRDCFKMVFEMFSRVPEAILSQLLAKKAKSIDLYNGLLDMLMLRLDTTAGLVLSSLCHVSACSWMSSTSTT